MQEPIPFPGWKQVIIEDTAVSGVENGDAYSRYILEVVANVQTNVKSETPEIVKKILEGDKKLMQIPLE